MNAQATVALGLVTALDITTARQLHDYGSLDDAGVTAALEQVGLERNHGAAGRPAYLTRLQHAGLVVDDGDTVELHAWTAATLEDERVLLQNLFARLPDATARAVAWHAHDWPLLRHRAYRHAAALPPGLKKSTWEPLCELFDDGLMRSYHDVQADVLRLYGNRMAGLDALDPALWAAVQWYELDLRRRLVHGALPAGSVQQCHARLADRLAQYGISS